MSYAKAKKIVELGCQAFMASLVSYSEDSTKLASIPMVLEFFDVFP